MDLVVGKEWEGVNLIFDDSVVKVEFHSFTYTDVRVDRIFFGKNIREVMIGAFFGTKAFQVELNDGLQKIGIQAFAVSNIEEVIFPPSIVEIGDNAFAKCKRLEHIKFRGIRPPKIGLYVFDGYKGNIYVPRGSKLAYERVLKGFKIREKNNERKTKQDFYRVGENSQFKYR